MKLASTVSSPQEVEVSLWVNLSPAVGPGRKMVAVDDCGVRINPMIVEGEIMGGLTEGFVMSKMQQISFDEEGNCLGANFTDYLLPTAWESLISTSTRP